MQATTSLPAEPRPLAARRTSSVLLVIGGSACLSASAMLVKLADANSGTAAFLRCALALSALIPLAVRETRKHGALDRSLRLHAVVAGLFLGVDYVMYTASILDIGAAIATVLINVQVIAFPVLARVFSGSAISRRFLIASPVLIAGVALASGALGHSPRVTDPLWGSLMGIAAGISYSGYLYLNQLSVQRSPRHISTPVCIATATAAATAGGISLFTTGIDLALPWSSWGWLITLALLCQVAAWLLISTGSRTLAPNTAATLLLLQPVMAIALGLLVLHETPVASQLLGCAVVVGAVWFANRKRTGE